MYFYLIIFLFIALCSIYELYQYPKKNKLLVKIIIFLLFLIAGFRYETGVDWMAYEYQVENACPIDEAFNTGRWDLVFPSLDIGFALLNSIVKFFGGGIQVIFFIISLVSTSLLRNNVQKYSPLPVFTLLVYYTFFFFIFDLSGLRQGLAIQIFFYSIRYIESKKFFKYMCAILLAVTIHWTSILLLPMYFVLNKKASIRNVIIIIVASTVIFSFQIKWLGAFMGDILSQINGFTLLAGKVNAYTTNDVFSQNRGWNMYSFYVYIKIILLLAITYKKRNDIIKDEKSKYFNIFFNLSLAQFFCIFTFYEFYEMSERFKFYFLISEVVLFPWIIVSFYFKFQKQIISFVCIIFVFFNSYIYLLELPTAIAYTPYQNYIIYKLMDKESTGYQRLKEHIKLNGND
ncbi:EpsG family protein [Chryseobacterium rhizosphaerae]|uniref:EpsG family protein n=1 Tax=Chryseobacterium rhizosphaerae TaxID=395937 RepID=UPI00235A16F8|nr:EpsG family protein [Chryseobacterium rhizosphaerae]MDC8098919.1 EpsG family protein [Chryseobacterium rhizosphaerae]